MPNRSCKAKRHLDEAIAAARSLSFELFPPVLQSSGLPAALTWLARRTRNKYGIDVQVSADPLANSARKDVRTLLFESVRELLFNAVKHAHVDRVSVDLAVDADDTLCITVSDQGIGFDPAERRRTGEGRPGRMGPVQHPRTADAAGWPVRHRQRPGRGHAVPFDRAARRSGHQQRTGSAERRRDRPGVFQRREPASRAALKILIVDDHAARAQGVPRRAAGAARAVRRGRGRPTDSRRSPRRTRSGPT